MSSSQLVNKRARARSASDGGASPKRNRRTSTTYDSDAEVDNEAQRDERALDSNSDDDAPADPVQAVTKHARSAGRARPTAAQKRAHFLEKYNSKTPEEILGEL